MVYALERGFGVSEVAELTSVDPWFVDQLEHIAAVQRRLRGMALADVDYELLRKAKSYGFSDRRVAHLTGSLPLDVRERRRQMVLWPVFKRVDTCAAEFESHTPYLYSTFEHEDESAVESVRKVMILGSGPNRIGQGIEFDYCSCHASFALRDAGVQSIMVNCNPETVSTDYDTSDHLYFEPLTLEDVLTIVDNEQPEGIIVQFGGQTPLNLTGPLHEQGVTILGTSPDSVDLCEDRERFNKFLDGLGIIYPPHAFASSTEEAEAAVAELGFPVLVRPSYVLGGRAMAIVFGPDDLGSYIREAFAASTHNSVLVDKFLEDAFEFDVDALCDGERCVVAGIMQHVEEAGVHSGDSSCVLSAFSLGDEHRCEILESTRKMALGLGVVGLMNVQYAIADGQLYVLEVNPRASRTVPFVSKATGVPLAKVATRLMLGESLWDCGLDDDLGVSSTFVKTPVFPFVKFPGQDPRLTPEMRSTGEVMGVANDPGVAFFKAQLAAGQELPQDGVILVTVNRRDREAVVPLARRLSELGFKLLGTRGTASRLREAGIEVEEVLKRSEGSPNCVDAIEDGRVRLVLNTTLGEASFKDGWAIRTAAISHGVPCITTLSAARAAVEAIDEVAAGVEVTVRSLQELHSPTI